ncbi:unnamed protein product, partial [Rotaria sp. Silwood1]
MSTQDSKQRILENFIIIWLDPNTSESDVYSQNIISQLRCVSSWVGTFVDPDQCIDYLTEIENEKAFIIVSDNFGQQLVPLILDIPELFALYVFCREKQIHDRWIKDHHKVKGVFSQMELLCNVLKRDMQQADLNLVSISFAPETSSIDINNLDQSFMYSQLLKEILLKMEYNETAKTEFVEFCLIQQVENESAISIIDEFEQKYDQPSPIW